MQDLAISSRITWRKITSGLDQFPGLTMIPINPNRVALSVVITASGNPVPIGLDTNAITTGINGVTDTSVPTTYLKATVTDKEYPGIFNQPLFVNQASATLTVFEAVIDTTLSAQVQAVALSMGP